MKPECGGIAITWKTDGCCEDTVKVIHNEMCCENGRWTELAVGCVQ